jgi:phage shock protein C
MYHDIYDDHDTGGLYRARDGVLFGVCKGLAHRFNLSTWGIRAVLVGVTVLVDPWIPLAAYILAALLLRKEPRYAGF